MCAGRTVFKYALIADNLRPEGRLLNVDCVNEYQYSKLCKTRKAA